MASLASSSLSLRSIAPPCSSCSCTSSCSTSKRTTRAALHLPEFPDVRSMSAKKLVRQLKGRNGHMDPMQRLLDLSDDMEVVIEEPRGETDAAPVPSTAEQQMYLVLEAVADRVEMHRNIGEQRDNWNTLLLNSINMMTLTATTLSGLGAAAGGKAPLALNVSSTILFTAATGMLLVMNKMQPSQLAEEQRNAVRLFKQIESEIRSMLAVRSPTRADVDEVMERVLALDRAYPLPLLGAMLEKFPKKFEPATWWPKTGTSNKTLARRNDRRVKHFPSSHAHIYFNQKAATEEEKNGWSEGLELEMRAIVDVLKKKDEEDYLRLGNIALKANKVLAVSGPALTGLAAAASIFATGSSGGTAAAAAMVAVTTGSLAAAVNALEHGGQVGMVVEMYRNCAGFFRQLEESIERTLEERDVEKRENGELFQMKVAMKLGRSLSQLRGLARKAMYSGIEGTEMDEFGSKLF